MRFKRIKDLREDHDKFQKDIAQLLGISQQYYSEYEKGNRTIPINHLITLAKYYNTSIDYIVGLSDKIDENTNLKQNNIKKEYNLDFLVYTTFFVIFPFDLPRMLQQIVPPFFQLHSFLYLNLLTLILLFQLYLHLIL